MKTKWTTDNIPSQAGRRAVITGANSGIGFEAALALAYKGAELILPARTQAKADDAVARILKQVPTAHLHPEILDLAVQASVQAFAKRVIERFPGQSLDLLINNAGVMALPTREVTGDGFERQFATNYLGAVCLDRTAASIYQASGGITCGDGVELSKQARQDRVRQSAERARL